MKHSIDSLILRTAAAYMLPLLLLFSVFLLLRGHNEPGGGFVGGLTAAAAFALYAIAYDTGSARRLLRVDLGVLIGVGLSLALLSGLSRLFAGSPYLTGAWTEIALPGLGAIKLGTPLLFDIGVYLVVLAVTLMVTLTLVEEE